MKILLVANSYPPYPASGSRRAKHLAHAIRRAGHDVHVLTERLSDESSRWRVREYGLRVETVRLLPTLLDVYRWIDDGLKARRSADRSSSVEPEDEDQDERRPDSAWEVRPPRPRWKRNLLSLLTFPDGKRGLVIPYLLRGLAVNRRDLDLVYTTAPPRLTHLAGLFLHRITGVPWVAEFRDPWIVDGTPAKSTPLRSRLSDSIERRLEAACVATADTVVTVTRNHLELLRDRSESGAPRRVEMVRNGIPEDLFESGNRRPSYRSAESGPVRVVHLGNIYAGRNPVPFFRALADLRGRDRLPRRGVRIELIGRGEARYGRLIGRLGLEDTVEFRGWMPHEQAKELLVKADVCLLFAQSHPNQVPNKLYEYLGIHRPILAFADARGETARMLRQVGGHYLIIPEDAPSRVAEIVSAALRDDDAHRLRPEASDPEEVLASWRTDRQMELMLDLLSELA